MLISTKQQEQKATNMHVSTKIQQQQMNNNTKSNSDLKNKNNEEQGKLNFTIFIKFISIKFFKHFNSII